VMPCPLGAPISEGAPRGHRTLALKGEEPSAIGTPSPAIYLGPRS